MHAISRICGNESQPGLLLVEKLASPVLSALDRNRVVCFDSRRFVKKVGDPTFDEKVRSVKSGLILNSSDSCIGKLLLFVFVYLLCKFGDTFFMKEENLCESHWQLSSFEFVVAAE